MLAQSSVPVSDPESSRQPGPVSAAAPTPTFMSLGMVVLDEIHFPDGRALHDVPGGSGFYSTLGARLAVPPGEAASVVEDLLALRANLGSPKASVVWEPSPLFCHLGVDNHLIAAGCVDVVSPNDVELLQIARVTKNPGESWNRRLVVNAAAKISGRQPQTGTSDASSSRRWVTVIRCGEHGNLTIPRRGDPVWLPPYHDVGSQRVVDATGAGNAFLGAFAAVFGTKGDEMLASAHGAVAASFAVEQTGPPRREVVDGKELWNGEQFGRRLQEYRAKVAKWDTSLRDLEIWTSNP
ncbi:Protein MAK32 [Colletotrichum trifolii]|uniref:Protein MAK32 n=1 Tax=Colletotrichum trifolii TaxID=5466 RepID=A0A4R8RDZ4_COLTR|nr:Protein MAK32 [Colletotrichum trifolii]